MVILAWGLVLGHQAFALTDQGHKATWLSETALPDDLWVQPSSVGRDMVRPPERNHLEPYLAPLARVSTRALLAPRDRSRPASGDLQRAPAPSRRLLHHRSPSSSNDAQPA